MELQISVLSKTGGRPVNEDAYGFWSNHNTCFCVLSDGAGGYNGGEYASKLAVKEVLEWFQRTPECSGDCIAGALQAANAAIVRAQLESPQLASMRATILVLVVDSEVGTALWGHVGDTRLYCFRQQHIVLQTRDHSVLQSMVDAGYMQLEDLRGAPQRNLLLAALGDAVGIEPCIEADAFSVEDGDVFLMCTDGFWEHVDEPQMEQTLHAADSAETWLRQLEGRVIAQGKEGQDNYSALAVSCKAHVVVS
jgi:serine/threonine protein phosphatase PrpC